VSCFLSGRAVVVLLRELLKVNGALIRITHTMSTMSCIGLKKTLRSSSSNNSLKDASRSHCYPSSGKTGHGIKFLKKIQKKIKIGSFTFFCFSRADCEIRRRRWRAVSPFSLYLISALPRRAAVVHRFIIASRSLAHRVGS
jgi:hypothetical protein